MEVLTNYVENIFLAYEENGKTLQLKNDILSHMEDEYEDLKSKGISEEEIIGTIISKFGSFDDLLSDLQLKNSNPYKSIELSEEDKEIIEEYKAFSKKFPVYIAIGVILCIIAVGLFPAFKEIYSKTIAIIIFFTLIAIGVAIFIISGMKKDYYNNYFKSKGLTQYYDTSEEVYYENESYKRNNIIENAIHSILWMTIIIIYLFIGFVWGYWHPGWILFIIGGLTSGIISTVFALIINNKK